MIAAGPKTGGLAQSAKPPRDAPQYEQGGSAAGRILGVESSCSYFGRGAILAVVSLPCCWWCCRFAPRRRWAVGRVRYPPETPAPNLAANPDALASFERAASAWEAFISTPIRININAEIQPNPNPFVIGSTDITNNGTANLQPRLQAPVRNAMAARSVRPGDAILASPADVRAGHRGTSQPARTFSQTIPSVSPSPNQKALGLIDGGPSNTSVDAQMVFQLQLLLRLRTTGNGGHRGHHGFRKPPPTHEIGHVLRLPLGCR